MEDKKEEDISFILYYHYVDIEDPSYICLWQKELCQELSLKGRIRISKEGINGTLSGKRNHILEYINEMSKKESLNPLNIDWKLSSVVNRYPIENQQFTSLCVKVTKEVVSLDFNQQEREAALKAGPGPHLTPEQFHNEISNYIQSKQNLINNDNNDINDNNKDKDKDKDSDNKSTSSSPQLVLLDVRNAYETEIGRFQVKDGEETLVPVYDPLTRNFSEFKRYIDHNVEEFKDKKVLMYCTGGVRCERASAYMKSKGILNLYQLHGGIHRYQEAFPSGGYFKGKNFVYDPRCAIPSEESNEIIGRCRICSELFDDYKCKRRCHNCRILQLICDKCSSNNQIINNNDTNNTNNNSDSDNDNNIKSSNNYNTNNKSFNILCQFCDPQSHGFQR